MADAAETRLREYLVAHGIEATEVRRLSFTSAGAFAVVRADGRASNAIVEGAQVWLDPEPGLGVVGDMLRARDALGRREVTAHDVIYLVTTFGTVPPEIAGFGSYRQTRSVPGYPARLSYGDGGARLELIVPRAAGRRGATAVPSEPVYRAQLSISADYELHWQVAPDEVPLVDEP